MKKKLLSLFSVLLLGSMSELKAQSGATLNFDGVNDMVSIGTGLNATLSASNHITVEAWVNPSTNAGYGVIVGNYATTGAGMQFLLRRDGNYYTFWIDNGTGFKAVTSTAPVTIGAWQHVAGSWDGSALRIYVNGNQSGLVSEVTGSGLTLNVNEIWLGNDNANEVFGGNMDEVRIWNRVLCAGELQNNMNAELPLPQTDLLAYYQFNQGIDAGNNTATSTLTDASGNNNTGTLSNFALTGTTSNWIAPGAVTSGSVAPAFSMPSISVSGTGSICIGSTATLTASGATIYAWSNPSTVSSALPLDNVSTNAALGIGLRQLTSSYTGPAIRLRRSSDNVEQDFGFVGTELDTAAITTFLGGNTGYCVTMYDQTGNAGDVSQPNQSRQPTYIKNGLNGRPVLRFDGSLTQNLFNTVGYPSPFTAIYAARQNGPNRARMLTSYANNWLLGWWNGSDDQAYYEGWVSIGGGNSANSNAYVYSGASDGVSTSTVYKNGMKTFSDGGGLTGPNGIDLGAWQDNGEASDGDFTEVFVFNSVLSDADRQVVENSTATYYNVYQVPVTSASNVVTPTVTTVYSVVGIANGCLSNVATATLTVDTFPIISVNSGTICAGESFTMTPSGAMTYTFSSGSAVVTPTTNATYSVTGSNHGCVSVAAAISSVTVNSLPTISVNSGAICAGQSFTMTPSGANTYTYSSGSAVVTPTTDATYSVTGTDVNGCVSASAATSSVTVNALPTVVATVNTPTVCTGVADTINATGALTYTWDAGAGSATTASVAVTSTVDVTYTVTGTDGNGCENTAMVMVYVQSCSTGLNHVANGSAAVNVAPNPNNGNFDIELPLGTTATCMIYDLNGKMVLSQTIVEKASVDATRLNSGVYNLTIIGNEGSVHKRIVIAK